MKPATPLPWHWDSDPMKQDAEYIVHAANAYPRLVTKLQSALRHLEESRSCKTCHPVNDCPLATNIDSLLREIGEL